MLLSNRSVNLTLTPSIISSCDSSNEALLLNLATAVVCVFLGFNNKETKSFISSLFKSTCSVSSNLNSSSLVVFKILSIENPSPNLLVVTDL